MIRFKRMFTKRVSAVLGMAAIALSSPFAAGAEPVTYVLQTPGVV